MRHTITGITVEPASAIDQVGRPHTLTATLKDLLGTPQVGVPVTFTVTAGPNAGASGTYNPGDQKTNADGQVTFTYVGQNLGTDTIVASYLNAQSQNITSQPVTMTWAQTASPPTSVDKTFYTHVDTTLSVPAPGALANDTDTDPEHVLSAILVTDTSHGSLSLNPERLVLLHPQPRLRRERQLPVQGERRVRRWQRRDSDADRLPETGNSDGSVYRLRRVELRPDHEQPPTDLHGHRRGRVAGSGLHSGRRQHHPCPYRRGLSQLAGPLERHPSHPPGRRQLLGAGG